MTATASDDDPIPVVVAGDASEEVEIVAKATTPLPPTDMLSPVDPAPGESPATELLRLYVLLIAASILAGALGVTVVRRARV